MTDHRLNELLDDAARTYRVPPEPDLAAMWAEVEKQAFDGRSRRHGAWPHSPSWRLFTMAIAASLVVGVGLGRMAMKTTAGAPSVAVVPDSVTPSRSSLPAGYDRTATELLAQTVILLATLPAQSSRGADVRFASQATELLTTTRLLLDSPAASDARFKDLLQDLELILAQIARLKSGRGNEELQLITDAVETRDVVPRIHSAVARLSLGDN
jgi:hypothetical protein